MTTDTATATTVDECELTTVLDEKPFLRITGTFPEPEGRVSTIQLALAVGDAEALADDDEDVDEEGSARFKSWFTDFVTCVIASMRRPAPAQAIMLSGSAAGLFLADRMKHAEGCAGDCGQELPTVRPASPDAAAAQAAQDAQTGGE